MTKTNTAVFVDKTTGFPELPEGYWWRVFETRAPKPGYGSYGLFGPTVLVVRVGIFRKEKDTKKVLRFFRVPTLVDRMAGHVDIRHEVELTDSILFEKATEAYRTWKDTEARILKEKIERRAEIAEAERQAQHRAQFLGDYPPKALGYTKGNK